MEYIPILLLIFIPVPTESSFVMENIGYIKHSAWMDHSEASPVPEPLLLPGWFLKRLPVVPENSLAGSCFLDPSVRLPLLFQSFCLADLLIRPVSGRSFLVLLLVDAGKMG